MRTLVASTFLATTTLVPLAASADDALFDAQFWRRVSAQRLDRALGDYVPAASRPAVKIGEVAMQMDDRGDLADPQLLRSTGEPRADALLMEAAHRLDRLPEPPAAVDARTVLLRVAFVTPSGVAEWSRPRVPREPVVFVEEAERGAGQVVVVSAVR